LQANYTWNQNDLTLSSSSPASNSFYQQRRTSSQQGLVLDVLVYFRRLDSRFRPYLSVGTGFVYFSSTQQQLLASGGAPVLPPSHFSSIRPVLHVPVGIDVAITHRVAFRYSFSETIRENDVSRELSPPGQRSLANFQNLFGIVTRF
jgi:outer membrane protein W